ncbi:unnamed protein product, partial [Meganyctiphanes norvegica]
MDVRLVRLFLAISTYFFVLGNCKATRYGQPATHIAVARTKRSDPKIITAETDRESLHQDPLPHNRQRRHTDDGTEDDNNKNMPQHTTFPLNDSHHQVMIDWAGEGSEVVVCVTRDNVQDEKSTSNIYISYDYGTTFNDVTKKFMKDKKTAIINKFYKNEKYTSHFVFTDVVQKYIHITVDYGKTITATNVPFIPSEISHHPINPSVLLAYDSKDEERKLWISEDFGEAWRVVEMYVKSYYWFEATSPPTLYIERQDSTGKAAVLSSQTLFSVTSETKTVITGVDDFEVKDDFLFAIKEVHLLGSPTGSKHLSLWVSYLGGPFLQAEFPRSTLLNQHYYIADVSEGQVWVCVAHTQWESNLYVSSVPRSATHKVRFSVSLPRILYFNPSTNWVDTWLSEVADKSFADLHKVEGIRGVFIASQIAGNYSKEKDISPEHLTSLITFDQGAQWKPIQPPLKDADGIPISCKREDGCSLHLAQGLSKLYPSTYTVNVLSKRSAPGLIMATGSVGNSLKGHYALYVSTDAGINWNQVMKGNHLYTLGDHGGVLVAVDFYRSQTNEIQYSTDEGERWLSHKFIDSVFRRQLITSLYVSQLLTSNKSEEKSLFFIQKINMSNIFNYECKKDDYKTWSPHDVLNGRKCLLGRKEVYERRIPHTNCYNGLDYDRPISAKNCPCTREDYECDFGFVTNTTDGKTSDCIKDIEDVVNPYDRPKHCPPGTLYNRTRGYRLIPGDTCEGGRNFQYSPVLTACPLKEEREFLLVSTRRSILRYDLVDPESGFIPLPIPSLLMVITVDFDMATNCVYWSDLMEHQIKRMCFDGDHAVEILIEKDIKSIEGLALDWLSQNLYFVDGERKKLEVIRTDVHDHGRMRKTILDQNNLDKPRGIAVHPARGYLYISDWSDSKPKIARTNLDGEDYKILFADPIVAWPNGITLDFQAEKIYWVDAKLDYIATADLDGHNMRKIIHDNEKVMRPFSLAVYKSSLFWDDWEARHVLQAEKTYGRDITAITKKTYQGLADLKVFGALSQQGTNACKNQTSCKYLCMAQPNNSSKCLCPEFMKLRIELENGTVNCECPDGAPANPDGSCAMEENHCPEKFFACANRRCIPMEWQCDTDNDCGDNSDEKNCGERPCAPPSWMCGNGHCIAPNWRCDHDNDCGDNSDEQDCETKYVNCTADQFKCKNERCVDKNFRCDMEDDCRDGSDEVNCTIPSRTNCRGTEFQCKLDSRCLPLSWRCDGDNDCSDKSDEENCSEHTCEAWQFQCNKSKQCIFRYSTTEDKF